MQIKTDGLVIRDLNVGEADRIVTILTREKGIIRASAKGARIIKNRMAPSVQMLCHADYTIFQGRNNYIIDEAAPLHYFMGVRQDLEKLSLAQYLAELEGALAPREEEAGPYLRLILNALHLLETGKRPPNLIKAASEMRLLTLSGYMPDLVACSGCGAYESELMFLRPLSADLVCQNCAGGPGEKYPLSKGALAALRHTVYADFEKLFSFDLPNPALSQLSAASERYLQCSLERSFTTLEFYHSLPRA